MYFKYVPNIEYDVKPIQYPFSESEFVVAKNFFKRYQINPDIFNYAVYFNKYSIKDDERPETIANDFYEDPFLDWIIILTNNIINPIFDWPMSEYQLQKQLELNYDDPYGEIAYYETQEYYNSEGTLILEGGLKVDETFYNSPFEYYDAGVVNTTSGNIVSQPVTIYEMESAINEEKRQIFILKAEYLQEIINEFKKLNKYEKSSSYINNQLKRSGK